MLPTERVALGVQQELAARLAELLTGGVRVALTAPGPDIVSAYAAELRTGGDGMPPQTRGHR